MLNILKGSKAAEPLSDKHIRQKAKTLRTIVLKSIKDAEHVNALAANRTLSFAEKGLTIVHRENGSGKSGYVRILKAACRARLDRSFNILPDIYAATKGDVPTATVSFLDGTTRVSPQWTKGTPCHAALSAISVFDSAAGNIHFTGTNDIAYTPFALQGEAKEIKRVPFGSAPSGAMQGIRYTTLADIISATTIADIIRPEPKPNSRKTASGWRHLLRA